MKESLTNSFGARAELKLAAGNAAFFSLASLSKYGFPGIAQLPYSIKVLLESVLRNENGLEVTRADVLKLANYDPAHPPQVEFPFMPARVLMQDFTGVPAVVDLAAMRSAISRLGGNPQRINPLIPVDLVIDHSVNVDFFGTADALEKNAGLEFKRNRERYEFLRWGQQAFRNFRVVPPASGICHQVNLEYLGKVVQSRKNGAEISVFPDSLVGTDSHTTMINGLGIVGWGVGGIEAEAAMLGQPLYMLIPEVIGFKLTGALPPGATATDLVLTVTEILRKKGVVGKFIEYYGPGLAQMTVPDRATIANMAPEYGATMGFFPVDDQTLIYLKNTGRGDLVDLVERYCKEQGLFRTEASPDPRFKETLELDLGSIEPSLSGPKRPQDRIPLKQLKSSWRSGLEAPLTKRGFELKPEALNAAATVIYPDGSKGELKHGNVAIAAITSCTNTSNPAVLIAAGLLAKKAVEAGLKTKPYVKTSLAPGSKVVTDYLARAGLTPYLDLLGFNLVGYGCTTCIGNSGNLPDYVAKAVKENGLIVASALSGNRNFTGRINPLTKASYLASPPLVVAFALAGTVDINLTVEPIGVGKDGKAVYLRDIWPSEAEIAKLLNLANDPQAYKRAYGGIEQGNPTWNAIKVPAGAVYEWDPQSSYIQEPPFFLALAPEPQPIQPIIGARVLVKAGDSVTTDHISPAGSIAPDSPAGKYLVSLGIQPKEFNSYGSRRGNDRVMTRGTFANITFQNQLAKGKEGWWTTYVPTGEATTIYDASERYGSSKVSTLVLGGVDYGMGSSRDWAAKGTFLLGIRAVLAQSFERIHRSNLVGMGVLPLQFKAGENVASLGLTGIESYTIRIDDRLLPGQEVKIEVVDANGKPREFTAICRMDTPVEVEYYRNGGILQTMLRRFLKEG